jgi:AcrR family transcriptional regulator
MIASTPMAARRSGQNYHHGDLRRALLDATLELVAEKGPEGFTLRAAAKLAGVSDAAPYHHFEDKEALLAAVAEEGFRELHAELERAAAAHPASPRERARAMGVAYVLFAATRPSHFRVMVSRTIAQHARFASLAQSATTAFQLVRDTLMSSLRSEELARAPADQLVYGAWALVHGLAFLAIDGLLGPASRQPESLRALVDGVLSVFEAARTGDPPVAAQS